MTSAPPFNNLTDALKSIGTMKDADIPLAEAALVLAVSETAKVNLDNYRKMLRGHVVRVKQRHANLVASGAVDNAATRVAALKHILADEDGFDGDRDTFDHLDNANLIRTLDRRRGLPITLAILYINAGRGAGFDVAALDFPGHVPARLQMGPEIIIFDPFERANIMGAPELRALIKRTEGPRAELLVQYYQPSSNRDILIRLQNNIKLRQITAEDYRGALRTIERMRLINPDESRLLLDAGVLYARVGQAKIAIDMLRSYLDHVPAGHPNRADTERLIIDIGRLMN